MTAPRFRIAQLDEKNLEKVRLMEEDMGALIVALQLDYPLAQLSEEQLARLKALEGELGVVLVAYKK
jgi:hypothetical protein